MFFCSSIDGHLGCFHLAIVSNTGVNLDVQIPIQVPTFDSLGYILRSRIPGSHGTTDTVEAHVYLH